VRKRLGEIGAPTLVIHGTEDPLLPLGHTLALGGEIPGARLLTLEGVGHELPPAVWDVVAPAILKHTSGED
jgi:pimeloyl-ACP methyl ester carboxylesterase